jgi:hypothetical protein
VPAPFAAGFFDGETYHETWGDDCVADMLDYLAQYETPCIIYAHNGGKFDFFYMEHALDNPLLYIKARLVRAKMFHHEVRDSYAIIPAPLSEADKGTIDYAIFESDKRDKPRNRKLISTYLERDCRSLYTAVLAFHDRYGVQITMASNAMKQLKQHAPQENRSPAHDAKFRPFYMGGRNEVFAPGYSSGKFHIFDVNSLYPSVMKDFKHPFGGEYIESRRLPTDPKVIYFAKITATSRGALPVPTQYGLDFPHTRGEFFVVSHELNAARELGLVDVHEIHRVYIPESTQDFAGFVDQFMDEKLAAEECGDKIGRLLAKLTSNSGYGKFGSNPAKYKDTVIFDSVEAMQADDWNLLEISDDGSLVCGRESAPHKRRSFRSQLEIEQSHWQIAGYFNDGRLLAERPATIRSYSYHDVAIAASITSAARAVLLRALTVAVRPLYCDTDSIICESLPVDCHATRIGAWKTEASADAVFIAGKKLYACFARDADATSQNQLSKDECNCAMCAMGVKRASKGARLPYHTIAEIACGEDAVYAIPVPAYRIGRHKKDDSGRVLLPSFLSRTLARTGKGV